MFEQFMGDYNRIFKKSHMTGWGKLNWWERIMLMVMLLSALAVILMSFFPLQSKTMRVIWISSIVLTLGLSLVLNHCTKVRFVKDRIAEEYYKFEKEILEQVYKEYYNNKAFKPFLIWVKESCLSKLADFDKTVDKIEKTFSVSWVFAIIMRVAGFFVDRISDYIDQEKDSLAELLEALLNDTEIVYAIALVFLLFIAVIILYSVKNVVRTYYEYISKEATHRRLIKTIDYMLIEEGNQCHCFE